ncbi:MAG: O-methyltransferase [Firmicutes bacterium]|nr:O-methyltransferase [Bacillota bacterium]
MERNITNDIVTEYINGFYQPASPELGTLRLEAEAEKVPIILKETESFLRVMLSIAAPKRILEIGCAVGYSSMFFTAVTGAQVVTIEKDPEMAAKASANIKRLGYEDKIRIVEGDGEEGVNALFEQGEEPFDMVFIDAAKSHYKRFLEASWKLCRQGTVVISDNVLFKARIASDIYDPTGKHKTNIKKMREYVDFITSDPRMETSIIACGDGVSVSKIKNI